MAYNITKEPLQLIGEQTIKMINCATILSVNMDQYHKPFLYIMYDEEATTDETEDRKIIMVNDNYRQSIDGKILQYIGAVKLGHSTFHFLEVANE